MNDKKLNSTTGEYEITFEAVILRKALDALNMKMDNFVDMCIMSGCDYNNRIPRVGVLTSYKLIKKHKKIDNLPEKYDVTILNHVRCREIFSIKPLNHTLDQLNERLIINGGAIMNGFNILRSYGVETFFNEIINTYKRVPIPSSHGVTFPAHKVKIIIKPYTESSNTGTKSLTGTDSSAGPDSSTEPKSYFSVMDTSLKYLIRDRNQNIMFTTSQNLSTSTEKIKKPAVNLKQIAMSIQHSPIQVASQGKPENLVDTIAAGQLENFLLNQHKTTINIVHTGIINL